MSADHPNEPNEPNASAELSEPNTPAELSESTGQPGRAAEPGTGHPSPPASVVGGASVRVDSWIWSVRLTKTRSQASAACKGGHIRVNGERVKPSQPVKPGDEVRVWHSGREWRVVVTKLIKKRVGAPVAVTCYIDNSPPPPPKELAAPAAVRPRGAGRPTKRDRRILDRLQGN